MSQLAKRMKALHDDSSMTVDVRCRLLAVKSGLAGKGAQNCDLHLPHNLANADPRDDLGK